MLCKENHVKKSSNLLTQTCCCTADVFWFCHPGFHLSESEVGWNLSNLLETHKSVREFCLVTPPRQLKLWGKVK